MLLVELGEPCLSDECTMLAMLSFAVCDLVSFYCLPGAPQFVHLELAYALTSDCVLCVGSVGSR